MYRPTSRPERLRRRAGRAALALVLGYAVFWVVGSLGLLAVSTWAKTQAPAAVTLDAGIANFQRVDANVWRGAAPGSAGYRRLAELGFQTVVDLRYGDIKDSEYHLPRALGLDIVRIPIRDGRPPQSEELAKFLATVRAGSTPVFVHCGAGVGRTGSLSAAYLVSTNKASPHTAMLTSLAVGPPTVEQISFMRRLPPGGPISDPPALVKVVSRALDAPRQLWSWLIH